MITFHDRPPYHFERLSVEKKHDVIINPKTCWFQQQSDGSRLPSLVSEQSTTGEHCETTNTRD